MKDKKYGFQAIYSKNLSHEIIIVDMLPLMYEFHLQDKESGTHMTPQLQRWTTRIGRALRARRKSLGLTLEDLSLLSGATVPTLSLIERGRRDVKLSTLVALAQALRIDLPNLFAEEAPHSTTGDGTDNAPGYDLDEI